jgi:hypothetical protein
VWVYHSCVERERERLAHTIRLAPPDTSLNPNLGPQPPRTMPPKRAAKETQAEARAVNKRYRQAIEVHAHTSTFAAASPGPGDPPSRPLQLVCDAEPSPTRIQHRRRRHHHRHPP